LMPVTDVFRRPCGERYHEADEGGTTLLCECSTFAIGLCADCGKPVCGDCSSLYQRQRLCLEHVRAGQEAAARAAAEAWLTPEKFLALAAAAGNPGLRTWTIVQLAEKETVRKEGRFRTKAVTHTHIGRIGQYEIRGWALPCYNFASPRLGTSHRLWGLEALMLTERGSINRLGHEEGPLSGEFADFEDREKVHEGAITFDYQFPDWRWEIPLGEAMDLALRELCKSLNIPV
jgi:hypothetical protein